MPSPLKSLAKCLWEQHWCQDQITTSITESQMPRSNFKTLLTASDVTRCHGANDRGRQLPFSKHSLHSNKMHCINSWEEVQTTDCLFCWGHSSMSAMIRSRKIVISWEDSSNVLAGPTWQMSAMVSVNSYQHHIKNEMTTWIFTTFNYCHAVDSPFLLGEQFPMRVVVESVPPPWWILQESVESQQLMESTSINRRINGISSHLQRR